MPLDQFYSTLIDHLTAIKDGLPDCLRTQSLIRLLALSLTEDLLLDKTRKDVKERASVPEDLAQFFHTADITSFATLPGDGQLQAHIVSKQSGIIAGIPVAEVLFRCLDSEIDFQAEIDDGDAVSPGEVIVTIQGSGRGMLTAERTALNFLGPMSGTATLVRRFVDRVEGTGARILDTRKTIPGQRKLQKYAVRMGGGMNHRMGLFDMVLIKDNHIDGAGGIKQAVERIRTAYTDRYPIEVEVKNLAELEIALNLGLDRIMLDNMKLEEMRQAVVMAAGRTPLEASGNVRLQTVRQIAETGVDFISIGALTHSAPNFDLSMRIQPLDK